MRSFPFHSFSIVLGLSAALVLPPLATSAQNPQLLHTIRVTPREGLNGLINTMDYAGAGPEAKAGARSARMAANISTLLEDPDPQTRSKAAYLLSFFSPSPRLSRRLIPLLTPLLQDEDWGVRKDVLVALRQHGGRQQAVRVAPLLKDKQATVRLEASRTLGRFGGKLAASRLGKALDRVGSDRALELALLTALGDAGDRRALGRLKARLGSNSEAVRLSALRGLALLGDPSTRRQLRLGMKASEPYQRQDAASLLGQVKAHWASAELTRALGVERDPKTRLVLAEALSAQGVELGLSLLIKTVDQDTDGLGLAAANALERLKVPAKTRAALRKRLAKLPAAAQGAGRPLPPSQRPTPLGALDSAGSASADTPTANPLALLPELSSSDRSFAERLRAYSASYRGVRYLSSPLGESVGVDPDPLVRHDAVDCLTYVEQVVALSNLERPEGLLPLLLDIRYARGRPSFGDRNHLMMDQWIPINESKGYLKDITKQVGGPLVELATKRIDAKMWASRRGVSLPLALGEVREGALQLPYIPIEVFPALMSKIPDGSVLLVVRKDIPARPYRVTHLGFVFSVHGVPTLRHAAKAGYHKVVDERLATFVRRNQAYKKWPVVGFNLLQPLANPERRQALLSLTDPSPSAESPSASRAPPTQK